MSEIKTYKPYKKNPAAWNTDRERAVPGGRTEISVEIGGVNIKDVVTGETTSDVVTEYIYKDVYENMLTDFREYDVKLTLGKNLQMVVTYDNRILPYNKKCESVMANIKKFLVSSYKKSELIPYGVEALLAEQGMSDYSNGLKKLTEDFNFQYSVAIPVEMMGCMVKEMIYNRKPKSEQEENLMYMDYQELATETARCAEEKDMEGMKNIKDEIFYRFLQGDFVSKIG